MARALRFALFLGTFLSIWIGIHLYVFWRAVPVVAPHAHRKAIWGVGIFLGASYIVARIVDQMGFRTLGTVLEGVGATWMGLLFLAFSCLLVVDVLTLFGRLAPERSGALRAGALGLAVLLALAASVQGFRPPAVRDEEVRLPGLPPERDGTRVVLVSDLHLGALLGERWLAARVAQVEALGGDLVVVCGDLIDGDVKRVAPMLPSLRRLSAPLGVWAVSGNHEIYAGIEKSTRLMEGAGFRVLRDRWEAAAPGLLLAGVDDLTARRQMGAAAGDPLARALAGRPARAATILLSHTPWRAAEAARLGAGLMLSGHTHAGQIFPFGLLVRFQYPLLAGTYRVNGMSAIVCRGTGTWGPRMRLFGRGEIVRITLRAS